MEAFSIPTENLRSPLTHVSGVQPVTLGAICNERGMKATSSVFVFDVCGNNVLDKSRDMITLTSDCGTNVMTANRMHVEPWYEIP